MRLIDADELLKAMDTWDKFGVDANTKIIPVKDCYVPYVHYDDMIKAVKGMPTVEAVPLSVIEYITAEIEVLFADEEISAYAKSRLDALIDRKVNEVTHDKTD